MAIVPYDLPGKALRRSHFSRKLDTLPGMEPVPRNAPCPCGSGKKYKHCHLGKEDAAPVHSPRFLLPLILAILGIGLGLYLGFASSVGLGISVAAAALIIAGLIVLLRDPPPPRGGGDASAINFGR